jgi:uncharacterized protein YbjT (DUF2867 family)
MSDVAKKIVLVGASGLVGTRVLEEVLGRLDLTVVAVGRRAFPLPMGGRMQLVVADPSRWGEAIADIEPECVACAVGTAWQLAGENEEDFRAVDHDLVLATARAAREADVPQWIGVSAAGANRHVSDTYLKVKGEVEDALIKLKFRRLDVLRPGLLRGPRGGERGLGERLGIVASPVIDLLRQGGLSQHRSIDARVVARSILQLAREKAPGRFIHDNEAIQRVARRLPAIDED